MIILFGLALLPGTALIARAGSAVVESGTGAVPLLLYALSGVVSLAAGVWCLLHT